MSRREVLSRRIRLLVAATITYNVIEAVIALAAGTRASSMALIGFGLDSVVEVSSAAVVAWQFAGRDRPGPLHRVRSVPFGVGHVVDRVHRGRGEQERERGDRGAGEHGRLTKHPGGQRGGDDQEVLGPLARPRGLDHGPQPPPAGRSRRLARRDLGGLDRRRHRANTAVKSREYTE